MVAVLVLVIIGVIFFIILIALWRNVSKIIRLSIYQTSAAAQRVWSLVSSCLQKPHYEARWKLMESEGSDGQSCSYVDPEDLPYSSVWEIPRDQVALGT